MTFASASCDWKPLPGAGLLHPAMIDPWEAALTMGPGVVIAVLTATTGPAYRDSGAAMAIAPDGRAAGTITSGCVETDLILQAGRMGRAEAPKVLRYGTGSPWFDLKLPCGGGIDVTLFPLRDPETLAALSKARAARREVWLHLGSGGRLSLQNACPDTGFAIRFKPALRHMVFGTGAEALTFARAATGLGQETLLISHDPATLSSARMMGIPARVLAKLDDIAGLAIDRNTAVTLFYHDHDYEPEILMQALRSDAFYIGAQGSRATQSRRLERLAELGARASDMARVHGPIGILHSSRDPQSLAISVLAEISDHAER